MSRDVAQYKGPEFSPKPRPQAHPEIRKHTSEICQNEPSTVVIASGGTI